MEVKETDELLFAVAQELKLEDKPITDVIDITVKKEKNGTESTGDNPENSEKT
jgi:hypothetical protein